VGGEGQRRGYGYLGRHREAAVAAELAAFFQGVAAVRTIRHGLLQWSLALDAEQVLRARQE